MTKEGAKAPTFEAINDKGEKINLKEYRGKRVILYFYPKDMTSGCTTQACDFRDNFKKFQAKDTIIIGVSKDSVERHQKFKEKYKLNFPLLADTEGELCKLYDVIKEKSMYGRKFMGIERTTFVISPEGKIEKIYNKVKVAGHVKSVLEEI